MKSIFIFLNCSIKKNRFIKYDSLIFFNELELMNKSLLKILIDIKI